MPTIALANFLEDGTIELVFTGFLINSTKKLAISKKEEIFFYKVYG
jgi:hypothetical protein